MRISRFIRRTVLTTTLQSTMASSTSDDVVDSGAPRQRQHLADGRLTGLLSAAVKHRDPAALRCLIERHDVDANSELVRPTVGYRRRKTRPLHSAMYTERHGLTQRVDVLLCAGADPNTRDGRGSTPLHVATDASEAPAARLLLARGADPNSVDGRGETCLHSAARQGHCELVRALLHHGANQFLEDRTGMLPVHVAALAGNYHIVEMLCGADRRAVESVTRHSLRRPIHLAAAAGHVETVALLAGRLRANLTFSDAVHNTALHAVVAQSYRADRDRDRDAYYACAAELLRHDVPVDTRNAAGQTPLAMAAANQFPKIAQLLLASGAQPLTSETSVPPQKQRRVDRKKTSEKLSAAEVEVIADRIRKKPAGNVDENAVEGRTTGEESQRSDKQRRSSSRTSSASEQTPPRHAVDPATDSVKLRKPGKSTSRPGVDNEISTFSMATKGSGERMCIFLDQKPSPQDVDDRIRSRRSIEGEMSKARGIPKHDVAKKLVAVEIETDESMEFERKPSSSDKKQPRRSAKNSSRQEDAGRKRDKDQETQKSKDLDSFVESKEAGKGSSTEQAKQPSQPPPSRDRITDSPADEIFLDPESGAQEWFGRPGAVSPVALKDVRRPILSVPGYRSTSKSPSGFVSEGGGGRGLKLRVAGVVPKAYNRRQKDAARRAFFAARPVAIESIGDADLDDVSQMSMASMPEIGYEAWERSVARHQKWSEPLEPVYGKPPKHHGLNVSFSSSRESPALSDDKVLIGPYAPPYRSTGPIDVKTDLIEEMLLDDNLSYDYDSMEWNDDDVPDPQFGDIDDIGPRPPPEIMDRHQAVEELLKTSPTEHQGLENVDEDKESSLRMGPPEKTSLPAEKIAEDKMRKAEIDKAFEEAKRRLSHKSESSADVPQKSKRDKKKRRPEASVTTSKAETEPEEKKQKPQQDTRDKHVTKGSHEVHFEEHEIRTVVHSSTVVSSQSTTSKIQRLTPENFVVTADLSSSEKDSENEGQGKAPSEQTSAVASPRTQPSPVKGILKSTSKYSSYDDQSQRTADKYKTPSSSKIPVSILKTEEDKKRSSESESQQHTEKETPQKVDRETKTDDKQSGLEQGGGELESTKVKESAKRSDRDESKVPQEKVSQKESGRERKDKDRSRIPVPSKDTDTQSGLVPVQSQATELDDRKLSTTEEEFSSPHKKEREPRRQKVADDSKKQTSQEQQKVAQGESGKWAKDSEATQQPEKHLDAMGRRESSTIDDETTERGAKVISVKPAMVDIPQQFKMETTLKEEYSVISQETDTRKKKTSKQRECEGRPARQPDAVEQDSSTMEDETTERGAKVISLKPATADIPKQFKTKTTLNEEYCAIISEADSRKKKTPDRRTSKQRERKGQPERHQDAEVSSPMEDEATERGTKVISLQPAMVEMPQQFKTETTLDDEYSSISQEADTGKKKTTTDTLKHRERAKKPAREPDAAEQHGTTPNSSAMEDETTERGTKVLSLKPAAVQAPQKYEAETTLFDDYSTVIRDADSRKKKTTDASKHRERAKQPATGPDDVKDLSKESSTMEDETTGRGTKVISLEPATADMPKRFETETTLDEEYSVIKQKADAHKKKSSKQREREGKPARHPDAVEQDSSMMEDETTERGAKVISLEPATVEMPKPFKTKTTLDEEYSTITRDADSRKEKTPDRRPSKQRERKSQQDTHHQSAEEAYTMKDETTERSTKVISLQPATIETPKRFETKTTLDEEYSTISQKADTRKKKTGDSSMLRERSKQPATEPDEAADLSQKSSTVENKTTERGAKVISLEPATVDMSQRFKTETSLDEEYSIISQETDTRKKKTSKQREREGRPARQPDAVEQDTATMEDETTERGAKVISLKSATVEMPKQYTAKTTLDEEYSSIVPDADSHKKKTSDRPTSKERERKSQAEKHQDDKAFSTTEDETTERGTKVILLEPAAVEMPKRFETKTTFDEKYSVISQEADTGKKKTSDRPTSKQHERARKPKGQPDTVGRRDSEQKSSAMEDERTEKGTKVISLQPATVDMPQRFETKTTLDEEYSTITRDADSHEKKTDALKKRDRARLSGQEIDENANANVSNINTEYNEEPGSRSRKPRDRVKPSRTQEDQQTVLSDEFGQPTSNINYDSQPAKHESGLEVNGGETNIDAEYSEEPGSRRRKPCDRTKPPPSQPPRTQEDQRHLDSEKSDKPTSNINYDLQPAKHAQPGVLLPTKSSTDGSVKTTATENADITQSQPEATTVQDDQHTASRDTSEEPSKPHGRRHTEPRDIKRRQPEVTGKDTASTEAESDAVAKNKDAKSGREILPPEKKTQKSAKGDEDDARRSKTDSTSNAEAAGRIDKQHGWEPEREKQKKTCNSDDQESEFVEREADIAITSFDADESRVGTLEPSSSRVERLGETVQSKLAAVQPPVGRAREESTGDVESYDVEPGSKRRQHGDRRKKKDSTQPPLSSETDIKTREGEQHRLAIGATDEQIHEIVIGKAKEKIDKAAGDGELRHHLPKGPAIRPDVWEEAMNDEPLASSDVVYDDVVIPTEETNLPPATEYTSKPAAVNKDKPRKTLAPPRERKKPRSPKLQSVKETSFDEENSEESSSESYSTSEGEEEETKPTQKLSHDSSPESISDEFFSDVEQELQYDREPSKQSDNFSTRFDAKESYDLPAKYDKKTFKENDTGGKTDQRMAKETDVDEEFKINLEDASEVSVPEKHDSKETNVDDDTEDETEKSEESASESDVAEAESIQEPIRKTAESFGKITAREKQKEPWEEDNLSDYDIPVPGAASKASKDADTKQTAASKDAKERTVDYKGAKEAERSTGDENESEVDSETDTKEIRRAADGVQKSGDADRIVTQSTVSGPSVRERRPGRPKLPSKQEQIQVLPPKSLEETEPTTKEKKRQMKTDKAVYRVQEAEQEYERRLAEDAIRTTESTDERKLSHDANEDTIEQPAEKVVDIDLKDNFEEWTSDEDKPPLILSAKDRVLRVEDDKDKVDKDKVKTSHTVDRFDKERSLETAIDEDNLKDTHAHDSDIQQPNNLRPIARRETSYQETSFDDVEPETTLVELRTTEDKKSGNRPESKPESVSLSKDRRKKLSEMEQNADDEEMFPSQHLKQIGKGRVKKTDQRKRLSASLFVDPNADKHKKTEKTEDVKSKPETVPTDHKAVGTQKEQERKSLVTPGETNLDDLSDISAGEDNAAKPLEPVGIGFDHEIDTETAVKDEDEQNKTASTKNSAEDARKRRRDKKRGEEPAGPTSNQLKFTEHKDGAMNAGGSENDDDYKRQTVTVPQPQHKYQQYYDDDDDNVSAEQPEDEVTSLTLPQKRTTAEDGRERSSQTKQKKTKKDRTSKEDTTEDARTKKSAKRESSAAAETTQIQTPSSDVGEDEEMQYISQPPAVAEVRRSVQETNVDDEESDEEELAAPVDEESLELPDHEIPTVKDADDSDTMGLRLSRSQRERGLLFKSVTSKLNMCVCACVCVCNCQYLM